MLNVFFSITSVNAPLISKAIAIGALVHRILEYTCTVWAPHTQKSISKIKAVQRRAARYVTQVMPAFLICLHILQWTSLNNQRESLKIIMLYKIIQQLTDIPKSNLIPVLDCYCT